MLQAIDQYIREQELFDLKQDRLLIAVSGGLDSVLLTRLLHQLGAKMGIAHVNYQLRGEASDGDAIFVRRLAAALQVDYYEQVFDTEALLQQSKDSLQMLARKLRYDWFEELRKEQGYDYILTAHHANDNAETLLLNLTHGCGVAGLTGIPPKDPERHLCRPLLFAEKAELLTYAQDKGIVYREDQSNASTKYQRNQIRLELMPLLAELNPGLIATFKQNIQHFQAAAYFYHKGIEELQEQHLKTSNDAVFSLDVAALDRLPTAQAFLYESLHPYGFHPRQVRQILAQRHGPSGAIYESATHQLLRDRATLILKAKDAAPTVSWPVEILQVPIALTLPDGALLKIQRCSVEDWRQGAVDPQVAFFDEASLQFPLKVRLWQEGDVFQPFGLKGKHKKVSKLLKDEKQSVFEKQGQLLLLSADEIIWVMGLRQAELGRVTAASRQLLKITYLKS